MNNDLKKLLIYFTLLIVVFVLVIVAVGDVNEFSNFFITYILVNALFLMGIASILLQKAPTTEGMDGLIADVQGLTDECGMVTDEYAIQYGIFFIVMSIFLLFTTFMTFKDSHAISIFLMVLLFTEPVLIMIMYLIAKKVIIITKKPPDRIVKGRPSSTRPYTLKVLSAVKYGDNVLFCPQCNNPYAKESSETICKKCGSKLL